MSSSTDVPILDLHPPAEDLAQEALAGLSQRPQPRLPAKLFYDDRGSDLFEQICELPEYYPTRTEVSILQSIGNDLARVVGPNVTLVEFGSGSTRKVRLLLESLDVSAYVPVDISRWYVERAARELSADYPRLVVRPVVADYSQQVPLPEGLANEKTVAFFPGGTIGNFVPDEATAFLRRVATTVGKGGRLLVGYDLRKDPSLLHAAYNDSAGVTAAFNRNVLRRLNETVAADFDLDAWDHYAPFSPELGRIEMHLVASSDQAVRVAGRGFTFERGTSIRTELSHKYTSGGFARLVATAGWQIEQRWTDADDLFCVSLLQST